MCGARGGGGGASANFKSRALLATRSRRRLRRRLKGATFRVPRGTKTALCARTCGARGCETMFGA